MVRREEEPTCGKKPLRVLFFMENFTQYSGGRYHLFQEAYTLASLPGVTVCLSTNRDPLYLNDFPPLDDLHIHLDYAIPPGHFDFVVGTAANCGNMAVDYAKKHSVPSIVVSLETPNFISKYRGGRDSEESYWVDFRHAARKGDLLFASATLPGNYLAKWADRPRHKVINMPPAYNELALAAAGAPPIANTVIFVSRVVHHKKLDRFLEAMAEVQQEIAGAPSVSIIGSGRREDIEGQMKELGVRGQLFSNITDVTKFQLIKQSIGMITCTTYEGFGMSPLEALACGVPVLAFDLPIFHETLRDYITYINPKRPDELKTQLKKLIVVPEEFEEKTEEGGRWVQEQYSLEAMKGRWRDVIDHRLCQVKRQEPKFTICVIALNEAEYVEYNLEQLYAWDCCHQIIIIEGSVENYPKDHLSEGGLSGDGTTDILKSWADRDKVTYISGTFPDKIAQRNEYARRVTGTHVLVVDADEFYSDQALRDLKEDVMMNPDCELFMFNFSADMSKRTYFHLWHTFQQHAIGGYWDIPHNRVYKWTPGSRYEGTDHNHPTKPDGKKLIRSQVEALFTRCVCVHTGFVKNVQNQRDKNQFYLNRGEGKELDPTIRRRRQMYIDCRMSYETWKPRRGLPHGASVQPFTHALPETLLQHPYFTSPKQIYSTEAQETAGVPLDVIVPDIGTVVDTTVVMVQYGTTPERNKAARECLTRLAEQKIRAEFILVDLSDTAWEVLPEIERFERHQCIHMIEKPEHRGLWQKEALINRAMKNVTTPYVILLDMDLYSDDPYWLWRIREKLNMGPDVMVQGFRHCHDTLFPEVHCFSTCAAPTPGMMTAPGGVWGMHTETFRRNGGLNPYLLFGGGDSFMVAEFSGVVKPFMNNFSRLSDIVRRTLPIKCSLSHVDVDIKHVNHGATGSRNYADRHYMTSYFTRPIRVLVDIDPRGILRWKYPGCPEQEMVARRGEMSSQEKVKEICQSILDSRKR